ncbi:unnamed protein product [Nezara viridula]|uniref:WH2 domain-containing protein n=1 Tax=Nezara viridula TaxID=85310 RepID=A0A9P0H6I8_NEZVI|nr:unnamed protein product [Nezara viridula]
MRSEVHASERKLNPPRSTVSSPRELLLESIKQGQVHLKPSPVHRTILPLVKASAGRYPLFTNYKMP